jgi:hypothetical protein
VSKRMLLEIDALFRHAPALHHVETARVDRVFVSRWPGILHDQNIATCCSLELAFEMGIGMEQQCPGLVRCPVNNELTGQ